MTDDELLYAELDRTLFRGMVFSLLWLAGLGSLYAFWCGVRARRMSRSLSVPLNTTVKMIWCIVVGAIGMVIWVPIILIGIVNNLR